MECNVSIRFCGQVIVPNENGELEFEAGSGTKTKIPAEEVHKRLSQAQSFEEAIEYLKGSGAYVGKEDSRVMVVMTPNGSQIFSKDDPGQKIAVDKDIPENVINEILNADGLDSIEAVERILISNNIIEEPEKEAERVKTINGGDLSFEKEADNVDSRSMLDGGEIANARLSKDMLEDPRSGIISEEAKRNFDEERLRKRKEERAKDNGLDR